ncbi:hypothetical protein [Methylobacterium sp. P1-11]|uniref:hypothetical protein n=1 Tax=Methylobacterium sp. P1-11 TaxID=2024616 RepID=UPI0011F06811|nr:hypothetical protein [Methylobacterium sp. P1-11]
MAPHIGPETETRIGFIDDHPDIVIALGKFIARWSLAEATLTIAFGIAAKVEQDISAGVLSSTNSAEAKIRLVKTAVKQSDLPEDNKKSMTEALSGLLKLCERRNEICHHIWGATNHGDVLTWDFRQPPGLMKRHKFRTTADINRLSNAAIKSAYEICKSSGSRWVTEATVAKYHLPDGSRP